VTSLDSLASERLGRESVCYDVREGRSAGEARSSSVLSRDRDERSISRAKPSHTGASSIGDFPTKHSDASSAALWVVADYEAHWLRREAPAGGRLTEGRPR
jgi:hypothetical protein